MILNAGEYWCVLPFDGEWWCAGVKQRMVAFDGES